MLELIIFILATVGLTFIISLHFIFKWLRDYFMKINPSFLGKGINCPACVGFWSGLIVNSIQLLHYHQSFDLNLLLYGFIGSLVSYIIYLLIKPLIDKYD
jgi:hypothetical protein